MRRIPGSGFDEQLIFAAKAGDRIAYGRLVELYQSPIRGFLRQLTRQDFALADDLAQDTFMLAYKRLETFRQEATFKSWLTSIAYKMFLQYMRKNKRRQNLMTACLEAEIEVEQEETARRDNKIDIDRALSLLKIEERTALSLNYREGMSHSEISQVMQIPIGTVKSHISRGRENLKKLLSNPNTRRSQ